MDTLEFRLAAPEAKREPWAENFENPPMVVEIYLNGRELVPLLKEIETAYDPDLAGKYGHNCPGELYRFLTDALASGGADSAPLLCCDGCGDPGCWSVRTCVREDGGAILWEPFTHSHRDWEYPLSFRFSKPAYQEAMEQLRAFAEPEC